MSVPLKIRGEEWTLRIRRLPKTLVDGRELDTHGKCDWQSKTITLNPDHDMVAALLHEVTHACQKDLDEHAVLEIEEAHVAAQKALKTLAASSKNRIEKAR